MRKRLFAFALLIVTAAMLVGAPLAAAEGNGQGGPARPTTKWSS